MPTRMRPVVVWPEISSPAQSLASVMNVPSNSCLPRAAFCSFCLGSLGPYSASFAQQRNAKARHISTMSRPARNVQMLDSRKHQYFRTTRHGSPTVALNAASDSDGGSVAASSLVIPRCRAPPTSVEASTPVHPTHARALRLCRGISASGGAVACEGCGAPARTGAGADRGRRRRRCGNQ